MLPWWRKLRAFQKQMWAKVTETSLGTGLGCCWRCLGRRSRENNLGKEAKLYPVLCQPKQVSGSGLWEAEKMDKVFSKVLTGQPSESWFLNCWPPKAWCCTGSSGWSKKHLTSANSFLWENPQDHNIFLAIWVWKWNAILTTWQLFCLIFHKPSGVLPIFMCWQ